jgi:hypothetical protein
LFSFGLEEIGAGKLNLKLGAELIDRVDCCSFCRSSVSSDESAVDCTFDLWLLEAMFDLRGW